MKRREFLEYQLKGALWLSAATPVLMMPDRGLAATQPDVAVVKGAPAAAARAAVEMLGGMKAFVKRGQRVLIKPNMSFAQPVEAATNTHPDVVRELAIMCKEAGASSVLVLDHTLASPQRCLELSGIQAAGSTVDPDMVHAVNDSGFYRETPIRDAVRMSSNEILKEALRCDVLIAAPVAKSHSSTGVSLSMKGMMGLVYDRRSMHWKGLDDCIVDLCTVLRADLAVIDASRVLSTSGPGGPGKVLNEKTVIASPDMVAADACAVGMFEWYGRRYQARQVGHIKTAHERGLGRMDVENLTVRSIAL